MSEKLDTNFRQWLDHLANDWDIPVDEVAKWIGAFEAKNRLDHYPCVRAALSTSPLDIHQFADAARECWVLGRYDIIRFTGFINKGSSAITAIQRLIGNFPDDTDTTSRKTETRQPNQGRRHCLGLSQLS
jgi:hypothetical protein